MHKIHKMYCLESDQSYICFLQIFGFFFLLNSNNVFAGEGTHISLIEINSLLMFEIENRTKI